MSPVKIPAPSNEVVVGELGPVAVFAAGGVVWRRRSGHRHKVDVLLVHRPRYDDWSVPKGKRDASETDEACALREVEEETGLRCRLGPEIATSDYVDRKDRVKRVRYWVMSVESGDGRFRPGDEVDELRWVSLGKARKLVSYAADVVVVDAFAAILPRRVM